MAFFLAPFLKKKRRRSQSHSQIMYLPFFSIFAALCHRPVSPLFCSTRQSERILGKYPAKKMCKQKALMHSVKISEICCHPLLAKLREINLHITTKLRCNKLFSRKFFNDMRVNLTFSFPHTVCRMPPFFLFSVILWLTYFRIVYSNLLSTLKNEFGNLDLYHFYWKM